MFRKPSVGRIIELLDSGLSERDVARALHASRNTVSTVKEGLQKSELTTRQLLELSGNELYEMFFSERFIEEPEYAPVDCYYVHTELVDLQEDLFSYRIFRRIIWKTWLKLVFL